MESARLWAAPDLPKLQLAWDSTTLKLLEDCPRRYELCQVEGWQPKRQAPALTFGILLHQANELFHKAKASGADHDEATVKAVEHCLNFGRLLNNSEDSARTRWTLTRAVIWYFEQFKQDPAQTVILGNGKAAVELSFRVAFPFASPMGEPYLWCGHIDRVVNYLGSRVSIADIKTTKYSLSDDYFKQYTPHNQVSGYVYGASIILKEEPAMEVLIDGVELKVNFSRYMRGFAKRTRGQIDEWLENTRVWLSMAERFAMENFWPMNLESCHKYGGCPMREICSKDPSTRSAWFKGKYEQRPWNPLESRET